jgi:hypothetical protein
VTAFARQSGNRIVVIAAPRSKVNPWTAQPSLGFPIG